MRENKYPRLIAHAIQTTIHAGLAAVMVLLAGSRLAVATDVIETHTLRIIDSNGSTCGLVSAYEDARGGGVRLALMASTVPVIEFDVREDGTAASRFCDASGRSVIRLETRASGDASFELGPEGTAAGVAISADATGTPELKLNVSPDTYMRLSVKHSQPSFVSYREGVGSWRLGFSEDEVELGFHNATAARGIGLILDGAGDGRIELREGSMLHRMP